MLTYHVAVSARSCLISVERCWLPLLVQIFQQSQQQAPVERVLAVFSAVRSPATHRLLHVGYVTLNSVLVQYGDCCFGELAGPLVHLTLNIKQDKSFVRESINSSRDRRSVCRDLHDFYLLDADASESRVSKEVSK